LLDKKDINKLKLNKKYVMNLKPSILILSPSVLENEELFELAKILYKRFQLVDENNNKLN
jgi:hypothetical protein